MSAGTMKSDVINWRTVVSSGKNVEYRSGMNIIMFISMRIRVMWGVVWERFSSRMGINGCFTGFQNVDRFRRFNAINW